MLRSQHSGYNSKTDRFFNIIDYKMLVPVLAMVAIGLIVLNTVLAHGYGENALAYPGNFYKQVGSVFLGVFLALLIILIDVPTMRLFGYFIYGASILMLFIVKIDGFSLIDAADSWLRVPVIGTFQPSELAKIGTAMVTGELFARAQSSDKPGKIFLKIILLYFIPFAFVITEVDLGTSLVLLFMFVATLFVWGFKWIYIAAAFFCTVFLAIPLAWNYFLSPFQKDRLLTFMFRGQDTEASYHINKSLEAVNAGGLIGRHDSIYTDVPVKESDFIFTGIAEQLGFLGSMAVILLALYFVAHTLRRADQMSFNEPAQSFTMVSLISAIAFHYIENIGMTVGIMPITGIPLPYISFGGSAMISNFISLGVLLNYSSAYKFVYNE